MSIIVHFRIRTKRKATKDTYFYIYCRLRIHGTPARSDMSTSVKCLKQDWDRKAQKIKGHSEYVRQQNAKLEKFKTDLDSIYNDLRKYDKPVSAEIVKQLYMKKGNVGPNTLLAYYEKYIADEITPHTSSGTLGVWKYRLSILKYYIEVKLKRKDIDLLEITPKWVREYFKFHVGERKNSNNYASCQAKSIMNVLDYAVVEETIPHNPTNSLKLSYDMRKPVKFLSEEETLQLADCPFYDKRLQHVVDCFILQCYTGFAYNELLTFDASKHIYVNPEGITYINIYRGKSNELCRIPMLKKAKEILIKYNYRPPVVPIRRMNELIKEAAKVAGLSLEFELSTHVGRSTAGTFLLNRGVPLHTVSKILGHKSIKTTESRYAVLLTKTITEDLKGKDLIDE